MVTVAVVTVCWPSESYSMPRHQGPGRSGCRWQLQLFTPGGHAAAGRLADAADAAAGPDAARSGGGCKLSGCAFQL